MHVVTASAAETQALARSLARVVEPGTVIALEGDLGAGKTTFTQGLAGELDAPEPVASPTFVLMRVYKGRLPIYHFDAYRLEGSHQLDDLDADEYLWGDGVCVVEWASRIADALPPDRIEVVLAHAGDDRRSITVEATGPVHARMLARLEPS